MIVAHGHCERCDRTVEVTEEQLLDVDRCRCSDCGSIMVLVADKDGGGDWGVDAAGDLDTLGAAGAGLDGLDGLVETFAMPEGGSGGKVSRAYDREEITPTVLPPPPPPPAALTEPEAGAGEWWPEDPDWAALLDETFDEEEDDADAKRVVIHLPESAADSTGIDSLEALLVPHGIDPATMGISSPEGGNGASSPPAVRKAAPAPGPTPGSLADAHELGDAPPDTPTQTFTREELEGPPTQALSRGDLDVPTRTLTADEIAAAPSVRAAPTARFKVKPGKVRPAAAQRFTLDATPPAPLREVRALFAKDVDRALHCAIAPDGPGAEPYRQLYQQLLRDEAIERPRSVLVTSACRGDGRSTVAANLAFVAARAEARRSILIAADPSGTTVLKALGLGKSDTGLLDLLRRRNDPRAYLVELGQGLDLLPLGIVGSDAGELLASEDVGLLVDLLVDLYPDALVVVDGPPVVGSAAAVALSRHVDGVLLVVRHQATPRPLALQAARLLGDAPLLGAVYNRV